MAETKVINAAIHWREKLAFAGDGGAVSIPMDVKPPLGSDSGPSPKQLLLMSICGCTGMDVAALLAKYKQPVEELSIQAEAPMVDTHPMVFTEVKLLFQVKGQVNEAKLNEAVQLSMTKYCGVSAMISKACPIRYTIELNGVVSGQGQASFPK